MIYVITTTKNAESKGFSASTHIVKKGKMCLNEKEVMNAPVLKGTLEERIAELEGTCVSYDDAKSLMLN